MLCLILLSLVCVLCVGILVFSVLVFELFDRVCCCGNVDFEVVWLFCCVCFGYLQGLLFSYLVD